ncbi:MAG: helix-turn-helix domain-containing protein [Puniceicoccales bacterium]|nr:helix-turn-helix domain-containing protein [Puniceicoccales bacterium]
MLIDRLRAKREEAGISQDELSKMLGRTRTFVSKVELGERRLDILEFIHYARALEIDPKEFFCQYVDDIDSAASN